MSYKNYKTAQKLVMQNNAFIDNTLIPQTADQISEAQIILGLEFPKSYQEFLYHFGKLFFGGCAIYGLDNTTDYTKEYVYSNIMCLTLDERAIEQEHKFPDYLVPIYDLGNGERFCLDTSRMNSEQECPIVSWNFDNIDDISDEFGEDFGEFLLYCVTDTLKTAEEEGKQVNWL